MTDTMEKWERENGVKFLKRIGIKKGHTVLDFGSRIGHYTIPAAYVTGKSGVVYAVDKEKRELEKLVQKTKQLNLRNIKTVLTDGGILLNFKDKSIDVVLLYDVLHYLEKDKRKKLFSEIYRVLKKRGWISVYPKHVIEDFPLSQFRYLHLSDVIKEIQDQNFKFHEKHCGIISHDDSFTNGCIFNFFKI